MAELLDSIMEGWITLHRKFLAWEWFDKAEMVQLFIWLLLHANHHDTKWQGIELKRGQLIMTTPMVQKSAKLSDQQIRTCIKRLKSTGEITTKATNKYTIVTICNYDRYQGEKVGSNGQNNELNNGQATDKQRTNNGQTTDTIYNNNETIKQCNNNNNNNISVCNNNVRAHEGKERDEIFKIFFLKNFVDPAAEVERFYNNYEAQGWVRGNGQKIIDRVAVARAWEQEDKTKQRFPGAFIEAIREMDAVMNIEPFVMRGIERLECDATDIRLFLVPSSAECVMQTLESHPAKHIISVKLQRQLFYCKRRVN